MPPALPRPLKWILAILALLVLLALLFVLLFDWNWLRGPIMRKVSEDTGRQLVIRGDLDVRLGWPLFRVDVADVTFANPAWASQRQMIEVKRVDFSLDIARLLGRRISLPDVRLTEPRIHLEIAPDGRKNWLLDKEQKDEDTRIPIGRLTVDRGRLAFDEPAAGTHLLAEVSTRNAVDRGADTGILFSVGGHYKKQPLRAGGSGGPVLALEDESRPYPLAVEASIGRTAMAAKGHVTNLRQLSALDMQIALRGESLVLLYPLIGIALPETPAYSTRGRLLHKDRMWRYENFSGRMGKSDIAGTLQVDPGAQRPFLHGALKTHLLDFADLGPLIGTRSTEEAAEVEPALQENASAAGFRKTAAAAGNAAGPANEKTPGRQPPPAKNKGKNGGKDLSGDGTGGKGGRVLPRVPYKQDRWSSVDADVRVEAEHIRHDRALPIDNLSTRIVMRDSVLKLDPLDFGVAGGHLAGTVTLDGTQDPIAARVKMQAKKLVLAKMFPKADLNKASVGHINGQIDLAGSGDAVAEMLANADGKMTLIIAGGEVSKLMMEMINLHLLEILQLKLAGDQIIHINCGIADFSVRSGTMRTNLLLLDTDITSLFGDGTVDLRNERLDMTINQKPKKTSLVSLRSPIHLRGPFNDPDVQLDKTRMATRGLGAIALGVLNPLLALIPLFDPETGFENECGAILKRGDVRATKRATGD